VRVGAFTNVDKWPDPHPPGRSPSASEAMDGRERPALRAAFSQWEKEAHQPTFFSAGAAGALAAGAGFSHGMRARNAAPTFSIW